MRDNLIKLIKDKKILILGFGREGKSTYKILKEVGSYKELAISDMNPVADVDVKIYSGDTYQNCIKDFDIVFKSPGVVIDKKADIKDVIITSEIEQFLKVYGKKTIGITGTKGKSTVSSLIYHVLENEKKNVIFAGNIGIPVFDIIDKISEDTLVVIELSCHQLENCIFSPHIAVFLNIYEDHLDHYDGFDAYYNAKKNIYLHQDENDILYTLDTVAPSSNTCKSKIVVVDKNDAPFKTFKEINVDNFRGEHNVLNCAFAYDVVKNLKVCESSFIDSVKSFKTLPHRLESIGIKDSVEYFDDSISTTVESCISAIKSIDNISTILIGGLDRGINYQKLIEYIKEGHVKNVILMYESGKRIYSELKNDNSDINIYYCKDLKAAVEKAKKVTERNTACVLSPAAASYGYFKNFEERGDKYKEFVYGD